MSVGAMRLDLGDLDLVSADGGYNTYWFQTIGEDVDFGEPQPVEQVIASLMADGSITDTTRYDNREITFRVAICGPDGRSLADGEAALLAQVGVRTTLSWTPPDGYGASTVFDVETSRLKFLFSDLDEVRNAKQRNYQLTLNCLPFGRSATPTTFGAEFVADSIAVADDCESTSGWSATGADSSQNPVTIAVDSTAGHFVTGTGSLRLTPAGTVAPISNQASSRVAVSKSGLSIDASAGGYLTVRLRTEWQFVSQDNIVDAHITTSGGGRQSVSTLVSAADANGFMRLSFPVPDLSTITVLDLNVWQSAVSAGALASPKIWFDSIGLAAASSSSQAVSSLNVIGSMRTEASFAVSAAVGLGDVLLYTCPDLGDGFRPDLRRYQTSGSSFADTAAVNGTYTEAPCAFNAPASMLRPGAYAVLARVKQATTGVSTLTVTASTEVGGSTIGPTTTASATFDVADDAYYVVRVGVLDLPSLVTDRSSLAKQVFSVTASGTSMRLDEVLIFPLEDSALTWVTCGAGAPSSSVASRLWVDEPSPASPRGARLIGNDGARLDARYAQPEARGRHILYPGRNLIYLLTSAVGGADLAGQYRAAWHSNAGA